MTKCKCATGCSVRLSPWYQRWSLRRVGPVPWLLHSIYVGAGRGREDDSHWSVSPLMQCHLIHCHISYWTMLFMNGWTVYLWRSVHPWWWVKGSWGHPVYGRRGTKHHQHNHHHLHPHPNEWMHAFYCHCTYNTIKLHSSWGWLIVWQDNIV